jgi:hypothetical protein
MSSFISNDLSKLDKQSLIDLCKKLNLKVMVVLEAVLQNLAEIVRAI